MFITNGTPDLRGAACSRSIRSISRRCKAFVMRRSVVPPMNPIARMPRQGCDVRQWQGNPRTTQLRRAEPDLPM
ncbi:MAG: hypothetical protein KGQ75_06950 [Sphingomonadales bacterium]|nr:hypothetical protein [Sphingomonadales bacterium]